MKVGKQRHRDREIEIDKKTKSDIYLMLAIFSFKTNILYFGMKGKNGQLNNN